MLEFDLPKEQSSIIKVIGVGGGGSNAVNYMYEQGIRGVNFVIGNTDAQALEISPIPNKIQLGPASTEGLGAGSNPEVGRLATEESLEEIRAILEKNTKMVFVTAGMGGGTGTGGAPVVAELARSMGILTVGICTTPFFFEGRRKMKQAEEGIEALRNSVDSLIVISNDKIREIYGNLTRSDAFARADNILAIAAKSISEIITVPGQINVDFADVEYVMKNSGVSIMGSAVAEGEGRAAKAIQAALSSPLLNDNDIRGAQKILLNITSGTEQMLIDEITEIHEYVQAATGNDTDVIFGTCDDESLGDKLSVTVIATGFEKRGLVDQYEANRATRKVYMLDNSKPYVPQMPNKQADTQVETSEEETPSVKRFTLEPESREHDEVQDNEPEVPADDFMHFNFSVKSEPTPAPEQQFTPEVEDEDTVEQPAWPSAGFTFNNPTEEEAIDEAEAEEEPEAAPREFEFTIRTKEANEPPKEETPSANETWGDEQNSNERMRRLRNLSMKLNNPNNLSELENVPAFKRRNIQLNNVQHSSQPSMSRFTLDAGEERGEIRKNNSFLHDNVD